MSQYYIRLDDACEKRNIKNWIKIEELLDKYEIKPLVGIIPHCEDTMMEVYETDETFWYRVSCWVAKGWVIALHGFNHVYSTECGGINPVNKRSEFAGESIKTQKDKIRRGVEIMRSYNINPEVFFAPSHTFDENTIKALVTESNIRFISDTIAYDCYYDGEITYIPQQSGRVRRLPFKTVTFCYHPNTMQDKDFYELDSFIVKYRKKFKEIRLVQTKRRLSILDRILRKLYFTNR